MRRLGTVSRLTALTINTAQEEAMGHIEHKKGFQSQEAKIASMPGKKGREVIESARVDAPRAKEADEPQEVFDPKTEWEPVKVTPKETIKRTRIGNNEDGTPAWYAFTSGKKCYVPRHVARILEEKGVV